MVLYGGVTDGCAHRQPPCGSSAQIEGPRLASNRLESPVRLACLVLLVLLLPTRAHARAWNGVEPGVTSKEEVVKRFGPPSKTLSFEGHQVLAYNGTSAIKGTAEAQFRVDPATGLVERIDVFPGPVV